MQRRATPCGIRGRAPLGAELGFWFTAGDRLSDESTTIRSDPRALRTSVQPIVRVTMERAE